MYALCTDNKCLKCRSGSENRGVFVFHLLLNYKLSTIAKASTAALLAVCCRKVYVIHTVEVEEVQLLAFFRYLIFF